MTMALRRHGSKKTLFLWHMYKFREVAQGVVFLCFLFLLFFVLFASLHVQLKVKCVCERLLFYQHALPC
jgi:hypothetical protein